MRLTDWEEERLLIFSAAELARRHRAAGLLLNAPEAIALICDAMLEAARAGASYADVEAAGRGGGLAGRGHAGRPRARRRGPARGADGRRDAAHRARRSARPGPMPIRARARPGRAILARRAARSDCPTASADRLTVRNDSRRAVRVSSHYPFERVNARLVFDREAAAASASTSPAGASLRWAPGETGSRRSVGAIGRRRGEPPLAEERLARYGPSTGDRIRLADSDLWIRVARGPPGDRRRAAMGLREEPPRPDGAVRPGRAVGARRRRHRRGRRRPDDRRRQGRHRHQGRPDRRRRPGGQPRDQRRDRARHRAAHRADLRLRPDRDAGRRRQPRPRDQPAAAARRAVGRRDDADHRRVRGAAVAMERTLAGLEAWPVNVGLQACARSEDAADLEALLEAGAIGFKIHEDYGAYPELIDADAARSPTPATSRSALHTDGLHESRRARGHGRRDRRPDGPRLPRRGHRRRPPAGPARASSASRTSSARPRRRRCPYGVNAAGRARPDDRHEPRRLDGRARTTSSWPASGSTRRRWRPRGRSTSSARSGSSTPTRRAWAGSWSRSGGRFQLADVMKRPGGRPMPATGIRAARGTSTIRATTPSGSCATSRRSRSSPRSSTAWPTDVGSLRPGRLADIVLWSPAWFGVKPELVLKSGIAAWAPLGDGNASVERAEPTRYRPDWGGAAGRGAPPGRDVRARRRCRRASPPRAGRRRPRVVEIGADARPDARRTCTRTGRPRRSRSTRSTGASRSTGRALAVEPVSDVPLSRRYFLR